MKGIFKDGEIKEGENPFSTSFLKALTMATKMRIEKMAIAAWKQYLKDIDKSQEQSYPIIFIKGYKLGYEAGVRKMIDREMDKALGKPDDEQQNV
jgi:hypothetical protein